MKKLSYVLIFVLIGVMVFMYFDKPSGHDQAIERLKRQNNVIKRGLDSAYLVIYHGQQREIALKARYMALQTRTALEVERAETLEKLYKNEKKRKTGIVTDRAYDSLLSLLFPR